jgi:hypothetical protein
MSNDQSTDFILGRIDGKLDAALQRQERHEEVLNNHDARISALEKSKAWLLGGVAVIVFLINAGKEFLFG